MIKRKFEKIHKDGGGIITLSSEDPDCMLRLMKHFSRDDVETIQKSMREGYFEAKLGTSPGSKERYGYVVDVDLDPDFLKPYEELLHTRTGMDSLPDIEDLTEVYGDYKNRGIFHTHVIMKACLKDGVVKTTIGVESEEWMGVPAAPRAIKSTKEYLLEDFGTRPPVPEFIELNNGLLKRNPKYPCTRNDVIPARKAKWFFQVIVEHWLEHHASDLQKEWVEADRELMFKNHRGRGALRELDHEKYLRKSWDSDILGWPEFRAMRG